MPATEKDLRYWSESSIPIVRILRDPEGGQLRWVNLSAYARTDPNISDYHRQPINEPGRRIVRLGEKAVLTDETVVSMIQAMQRYVRQALSPALLGLFDDDAGELDRALQLLVAYQYLADDPLAAVLVAIDRASWDPVAPVPPGTSKQRPGIWAHLDLLAPDFRRVLEYLAPVSSHTSRP